MSVSVETSPAAGEPARLGGVAGGFQTLAKASKLMEEDGIFGSGSGRSSNLKWENTVLK